jgi:hypothetical protein
MLLDTLKVIPRETHGTEFNAYLFIKLNIHLNSFRTELIIAFKLVSLLLQKQPVCTHQMIIVEQRYLFEVSFLLQSSIITVVVFMSLQTFVKKSLNHMKKKTSTVFIKIYDSIIYLQNIFLSTKKWSLKLNDFNTDYLKNERITLSE